MIYSALVLIGVTFFFLFFSQLLVIFTAKPFNKNVTIHVIIIITLFY